MGLFAVQFHRIVDLLLLHQHHHILYSSDTHIYLIFCLQMPNNSKANMPNMADEEQSLFSALIQTRSTILRNLHSIKQRIACEVLS